MLALFCILMSLHVRNEAFCDFAVDFTLWVPGRWQIPAWLCAQ